MRYSYSISKLSLPFASIGLWTQEPRISSEVFLSAAIVRNSLLIITTSSGWMECMEAGSTQPLSQPIRLPSSAHCKEKEPNPPPTDSERSVCRLEDFHRPQRPAPSSPPLQFWTQVSRDKPCSSRRPLLMGLKSAILKNCNYKHQASLHRNLLPMFKNNTVQRDRINFVIRSTKQNDNKEPCTSIPLGKTQSQL